MNPTWFERKVTYVQQTVVPAQYLQIARDLAERIARGELPEGSRIYGRSVMASEYNVSPETIRRALRLLSDMKVVEVKPQSGAVVLSQQKTKSSKATCNYKIHLGGSPVSPLVE